MTEKKYQPKHGDLNYGLAPEDQEALEREVREGYGDERLDLDSEGKAVEPTRPLTQPEIGDDD